MPKNYSDWLQLKKSELPLVIALGGEERAFVEEAVADLKKRLLVSGLEDFNSDTLSGRSVSLETIIGSANLLPIMASYRLVLVKDAEQIKAEDLEILKIYLAKPSLTTMLVFIFDSIDSRQKIPKMLEAAGVLFQFDHPREDQMLKLIQKRAERHRLTCDDETAFVLLMEIGTDLMMLERALEKLALSCGSKKIEMQDIADQISETRIVDAFALGKAVAMGDRIKATICLAKLSAAKVAPLKLVGMLSWQLRQVLKARVLLDKGLSENELGRELGVFGDRLKTVVTAAGQWKTATHISRLDRLYQIDKELKRSSAPAWLWLERVVFQLCPKL
jgi:DNA polymerase III subunit delta